MELLKKEKFNFVDKKIVKFFKLCVNDYINGSYSSREEFPDQPLDLFHDCFSDVVSTAKKICLDILSKEQFGDLVHWIDGQERNEIYAYILDHKNDIRSIYKQEKLRELPHLTDFDYNVKLSVSSNKTLELNEPTMSLFLHSKFPNDVEPKTFHLEMTLPEVKNLILMLRKAHKSFESLKS